MGRESVESRVSFDFIRYANCWEDADILCRALLPGPGKRILSIASAGDNVLALLAEGAAVVAVDLSIPQLACLELRCAAFRQLDYEQVLAFLGIQFADNRLCTFERLRMGLSSAARDFWSHHPEFIARGIVHAGKFERYFGLFRRWFLPLIHSRRTVRLLLQPKDRAARLEFWKRWNNRRWRFLFRLFFSRRMMGCAGRDPEFFRYVEGDVSKRFMERVRHGFTELPTHTNPFLNYISQGNYTQALPRYLRREQFENVRAGLDRLILHHGPIEQGGEKYRGDGFHAFNLSDIFEYLDPHSAGKLYAKLAALAQPGARLAYWNTLVARGMPDELVGQVRPQHDLAKELFAQDLAFYYGEFHVDEVQQAWKVAIKSL